MPVVELAEQAAQQMLHLVDSAAERLVSGRRVFGDHDRFVIRGANLDHALHVAAGLAPCTLVAEVNVDARDAHCIRPERRLDPVLDELRELVAGIDVVVCIDLDQHVRSPLRVCAVRNDSVLRTVAAAESEDLRPRTYAPATASPVSY